MEYLRSRDDLPPREVGAIVCRSSRFGAAIRHSRHTHDDEPPSGALEVNSPSLISLRVGDTAPELRPLACTTLYYRMVKNLVNASSSAMRITTGSVRGA
eukprot:8297885-Pyramimonas_sp.AAC.2